MRQKEITRLGLPALKLMPMITDSYLLSPSIVSKKEL